MNSEDAEHFRKQREEIRPRLLKAIAGLADSVVSKNIRERGRPHVLFGDAMLTFESAAGILSVALAVIRDPQFFEALSPKEIEGATGLRGIPRDEKMDADTISCHLGVCASVNVIAMGYTLLESLLASAPEDALDNLLEAIAHGEFVGEEKAN